MKTIQAGTKAWIPVEFLDKDGEPTTPSGITYSVYCVTTETEVRAATAISPAAEIEIELDGDDTAMQDAATNDVEEKKVCVVTTFGAGDTRTDIFRFRVVEQEACS